MGIQRQNPRAKTAASERPWPRLCPIWSLARHSPQALLGLLHQEAFPLFSISALSSSQPPSRLRPPQQQLDLLFWFVFVLQTAQPCFKGTLPGADGVNILYVQGPLVLF